MFLKHLLSFLVWMTRVLTRVISPPLVLLTPLIIVIHVFFTFYNISLSECDTDLSSCKVREPSYILNFSINIIILLISLIVLKFHTITYYFCVSFFIIISLSTNSYFDSEGSVLNVSDHIIGIHKSDLGLSEISLNFLLRFDPTNFLRRKIMFSVIDPPKQMLFSEELSLYTPFIKDENVFDILLEINDRDDRIDIYELLNSFRISGDLEFASNILEILKDINVSSITDGVIREIVSLWEKRSYFSNIKENFLSKFDGVVHKISSLFYDDPNKFKRKIDFSDYDDIIGYIDRQFEKRDKILIFHTEVLSNVVKKTEEFDNELKIFSKKLSSGLELMDKNLLLFYETTSNLDKQVKENFGKTKFMVEEAVKSQDVKLSLIVKTIDFINEQVNELLVPLRIFMNLSPKVLKKEVVLAMYILKFVLVILVQSIFQSLSIEFSFKNSELVYLFFKLCPNLLMLVFNLIYFDLVSLILYSVVLFYLLSSFGLRSQLYIYSLIHMIIRKLFSFVNINVDKFEINETGRNSNHIFYQLMRLETFKSFLIILKNILIYLFKSKPVDDQFEDHVPKNKKFKNPFIFSQDTEFNDNLNDEFSKMNTKELIEFSKNLNLNKKKKLKKDIIPNYQTLDKTVQLPSYNEEHMDIKDPHKHLDENQRELVENLFHTSKNYSEEGRCWKVLFEDFDEEHVYFEPQFPTYDILMTFKDDYELNIKNDDIFYSEFQNIYHVSKEQEEGMEKISKLDLLKNIAKTKGVLGCKYHFSLKVPLLFFFIKLFISFSFKDILQNFSYDKDDVINFGALLDSNLNKNFENTFKNLSSNTHNYSSFILKLNDNLNSFQSMRKHYDKSMSNMSDLFLKSNKSLNSLILSLDSNIDETNGFLYLLFKENNISLDIVLEVLNKINITFDSLFFHLRSILGIEHRAPYSFPLYIAINIIFALLVILINTIFSSIVYKKRFEITNFLSKNLFPFSLLFINVANFDPFNIFRYSLVILFTNSYLQNFLILLFRSIFKFIRNKRNKIDDSDKFTFHNYLNFRVNEYIMNNSFSHSTFVTEKENLISFEKSEVIKIIKPIISEDESGVKPSLIETSFFYEYEELFHIRRRPVRNLNGNFLLFSPESFSNIEISDSSFGEDKLNRSNRHLYIPQKTKFDDSSNDPEYVNDFLEDTYSLIHFDVQIYSKDSYQLGDCYYTDIKDFQNECYSFSKEFEKNRKPKNSQNMYNFKNIIMEKNGLYITLPLPSTPHDNIPQNYIADDFEFNHHELSRILTIKTLLSKTSVHMVGSDKKYPNGLCWKHLFTFVIDNVAIEKLKSLNKPFLTLSEIKHIEMYEASLFLHKPKIIFYRFWNNILHIEDHKADNTYLQTTVGELFMKFDDKTKVGGFDEEINSNKNNTENNISELHKIKEILDTKDEDKTKEFLKNKNIFIPKMILHPQPQRTGYSTLSSLFLGPNENEEGLCYLKILHDEDKSEAFELLKFYPSPHSLNSYLKKKEYSKRDDKNLFKDMRFIVFMNIIDFKRMTNLESLLCHNNTSTKIFEINSYAHLSELLSNFDNNFFCGSLLATIDIPREQLKIDLPFVRILSIYILLLLLPLFVSINLTSVVIFFYCSIEFYKNLMNKNFHKFHVLIFPFGGTLLSLTLFTLPKFLSIFNLNEITLLILKILVTEVEDIIHYQTSFTILFSFIVVITVLSLIVINPYFQISPENLMSDGDTKKLNNVLLKFCTHYEFTGDENPRTLFNNRDHVNIPMNNKEFKIYNDHVQKTHLLHEGANGVIKIDNNTVNYPNEMDETLIKFVSIHFKNLKFQKSDKLTISDHAVQQMFTRIARKLIRIDLNEGERVLIVGSKVDNWFGFGFTHSVGHFETKDASRNEKNESIFSTWQNTGVEYYRTGEDILNKSDRYDTVIMVHCCYNIDFGQFFFSMSKLGVTKIYNVMNFSNDIISSSFTSLPHQRIDMYKIKKTTKDDTSLTSRLLANWDDVENVDIIYHSLENLGTLYRHDYVNVVRWGVVETIDLKNRNFQFIRETMSNVGGSLVTKYLLHSTGSKRTVETIQNIISSEIMYKLIIPIKVYDHSLLYYATSYGFMMVNNTALEICLKVVNNKQISTSSPAEIFLELLRVYYDNKNSTVRDVSYKLQNQSSQVSILPEFISKFELVDGSKISSKWYIKLLTSTEMFNKIYFYQQNNNPFIQAPEISMSLNGNFNLTSYKDSIKNKYVSLRINKNNIKPNITDIYSNSEVFKEDRINCEIYNLLTLYDKYDFHCTDTRLFFIHNSIMMWENFPYCFRSDGFIFFGDGHQSSFCTYTLIITKSGNKFNATKHLKTSLDQSHENKEMHASFKVSKLFNALNLFNFKIIKNFKSNCLLKIFGFKTRTDTRLEFSPETVILFSKIYCVDIIEDMKLYKHSSKINLRNDAEIAEHIKDFKVKYTLPIGENAELLSLFLHFLRAMDVVIDGLDLNQDDTLILNSSKFKSIIMKLNYDKFDELPNFMTKYVLFCTDRHIILLRTERRSTQDYDIRPIEDFSTTVSGVSQDADKMILKKKKEINKLIDMNQETGPIFQEFFDYLKLGLDLVIQRNNLINNKFKSNKYINYTGVHVYDMKRKRFVTKTVLDLSQMQTKLCFSNGTLYKTRRIKDSKTGKYFLIFKNKKNDIKENRFILIGDMINFCNDYNIINTIKGYSLNLSRKLYCRIIFEEGIPGCGKTYSIINKHKPGLDLIITSTKYSLSLLRQRVKEQFGVDDKILHKFYRTYDSVLVNGLRNEKFNNVFMDEVLMEHSAKILLIIHMTECQNVFMYGDRNQLPSFSKISNFKFNNNKLIFNEIIINNKTYRLNISILKLIGHIYDDCQTFSKVVGSIECVLFNNNWNLMMKLRDMCEKEDFHIMTFTQYEKQEIINCTRLNCHTIHECQGMTVEKAIIVRIQKQDNDLYLSERHILVGITRHTHDIKYFTVVKDLTMNILLGKKKLDKNNLQSTSSFTVKFSSFDKPFNLTFVEREKYKIEAEKDKIPIDKVDILLQNMNDYHISTFEEVELEKNNYLSYDMNLNLNENINQTYKGTGLVNFVDKVSKFASHIELTRDVEKGFYPYLPFTYDSVKIVDKIVKSVSKKEEPIRSKYTDVRSRSGTKGIDYVIDSIVSRNLNPPLINKVNDFREVDKLVDEFIDLVFDKKRLDEAKKIYKSNNIIEGWNWMCERDRKQTSKLVNELKKGTRPDMNTYDCHVKLKIKPKWGENIFESKPPGQVVTAACQLQNLIFSSSMKRMDAMIKHAIKPNFCLYSSMVDIELENCFNYIASLSKTKKFNVLEADISKFDKSQNDFILALQLSIMRKFGMEESLIKLWEDHHCFNKLRFKETGIKLETSYQRRSGDIYTFLGNTLVTMITMLTSLPKEAIIGGIFCGDDSLILTNVGYDFESPVINMRERFNLNTKLETFEDSIYFTGKYFVFNGFKYVIVRDAVKNILNIIDPKVDSLEELKCIFISYNDMYGEMLKMDLPPNVYQAMSNRYEGIWSPIEIKMALHDIRYLLSDFELYKTLFIIHDRHIKNKMSEKDIQKYLKIYKYKTGKMLTKEELYKKLK